MRNVAPMGCQSAFRLWVSLLPFDVSLNINLLAGFAGDVDQQPKHVTTEDENACRHVTDI